MGVVVTFSSAGLLLDRRGLVTAFRSEGLSLPFSLPGVVGVGVVVAVVGVVEPAGGGVARIVDPGRLPVARFSSDNTAAALAMLFARPESATPRDLNRARSPLIPAELPEDNPAPEEGKYSR